MEIGNEIVKVSPDVNFKISAVITITYEEGYDVCVTVDYKKEKMKVSTTLEYYDEDYDDFD